MAARILSNIERNTVLIGPIIQEQSRDDLRPGDTLHLSSVDVASTYSWTLTFTPLSVEDASSSAALLTPTAQAAKFTIDNPGAYLIRLVVDSGLPTENIQFIRFRMVSVFADLRLVAAGERRDSIGVIPVDADTEGWTNDQNFNILRLESFLSKVSASGRVLFVDSNKGIDRTNPTDDFSIAEGYGDFSTITSAISAATSTVPAPSLNQPFLIKVQPGFYPENIALQPHIHILGLVSTESTYPGVVVSSVNSGGVSHTANLPAIGHPCLVENIQFENTEIGQSQAVLDKSGDGTLVLVNSVILQQPATGTSGQSLLVRGGKAILVSTEVTNNNGDTGIDAPTIQVATAIEGINAELELYGSKAFGLRPIEANKDGLFDGVKVSLYRSKAISTSTVDVAGIYGILSSADELNILWSEVSATASVDPTRERAIDVHRDGGAKVGNGISVNIHHSKIDGRIFFNTDGVVAAKSLKMGAVDYKSKSLSGANTGTLTVSATTQGDTILYDNTTSGFAWSSVQESLDQIAAMLGSTGVGGVSQSLDTSYDGVIDATAVPPVIGSGSGKQIVADAGAVEITGASTPLSSLQGFPSQSNGRLNVEGGLGIGAVGAPEINLSPNPGSAGPEIVLGQTVFPDVDSGSPTRATPAGVIRARSTGAPLYRNFHLRIETESTEGESNGVVGRIVIKPGDSLPGGPGAEPLGGDLHLEAGGSGAVAPGNVYLAPGHQTAPSVDGRVIFSNPSAQTHAILESQNAFSSTAGGNLSIKVGNVEVSAVTIPATTLISDVVNAINGDPSLGVIASANAGKLRLTSVASGPNSDILFAFDDNSGTLNTELGNLIYLPGGGGATYIRGAFVETVGMGCTAAGELTVFGNINATGSIGVGVPKYLRTTVNNAASPYTVLSSDVYIGVDSLGGPVTIVLDDVAPISDEGRLLIIKDEGGNAGTNSITVEVGSPVTGTIDGAASYLINNDYLSVTILSQGNSPNTAYYVI